MPKLRSWIAYKGLALYKLLLSPVFYLLGVRCRHEPSCSVYTAQAISAFGFWPGGWMGLARIWRCRPGGSSGYDPIPETCPTAPFWAPWRFGDWKSGKRLVKEAGHSSHKEG